MADQELPSRILRSLIRGDLHAIHDDYNRQVFLEMDSDPNPVGFRRQREKSLFYIISTGDTNRLETMLYTTFPNNFEADFEVGTLSERPFQQTLYLFISQVTLCTRAAIDGGLPENLAYALSDAYIRYGTTLTELKTLMALSSYVVYDFTKAVRDNNYNGLGPVVRTCCDYIGRHMHDAITLADLAEVSGRSENYISDRFALELGERPIRYIRKRKLEYARNVLEISDLSISAISDLLAFPSTSSFITYFKKEYGVSPMQYRNQ